MIAGAVLTLGKGMEKADRLRPNKRVYGTLDWPSTFYNW